MGHPGQGDASLIRTDFLTAFANGRYLNTGEYPALSVVQRAEVRQWCANSGCNALLLETEWPGDAHVPAFSWTKTPQRLLAAIPELQQAGIEPVLMFGQEGTGADISSQWVHDSGALAQQLQHLGVTRAVIGLECEEWALGAPNYQLYRQLAAALGHSFPEVYTHFHGGVISHPNAASTAQFYSENPSINGLMYQFSKEAHAGRFLVSDSDILAQLANVRALLPKRVKLFAGEYASMVSQDKSIHAGAVALSSGLIQGFWNGGPGKDGTHLPLAVSVNPAAIDAVPISSVTFLSLHGDITAQVRTWPIDAELQTVTTGHQTVTFPHTGSGRWSLAPNGVEGNVWECGKLRNGPFTCKTWDYIGSYRFTKEWLGTGLSLEPGAPLYFMVSATARTKFENGPHRTQIKRVSFH